MYIYIYTYKITKTKTKDERHAPAGRLAPQKERLTWKSYANELKVVAVINIEQHP